MSSSGSITEIESNITFTSNTLSQTSISEMPTCLSEESDCDPANFVMEEANQNIASKDNIIKILQEQLQTLHRQHKEAIDKTESLQFKHGKTLDELESLQKISTQCELENKRLHAKLNTLETQLANSPIEVLAGKIASVYSITEDIKQYASETNTESEITEVIEKINGDYQVLLHQQYEQIEDILNEHTRKLDSIKSKVCGDKSGESRIRFSMINDTFGDDDDDDDDDHNYKDKSSLKRSYYQASKTSMVDTMRITNDILEQEINDLRLQIQKLRQGLKLKAGAVVDDVIGEAISRVAPNQLMEILGSPREKNKLLTELNNTLKDENESLKGFLKAYRDVNRPSNVLQLTDQLPQLQELDNRLREVNIDLDISKAEIIDLKMTLEQKNELLDFKEKTIADLEANIRRLSGLLEEAQYKRESEIQIISISLESSAEELQSLQDQYKQLSNHSENTATLLNKTSREKDSINQKLVVMGNTMAQYKNELEVKQTECNQQKQQIAVLEGQIRNLDQIILEKNAQYDNLMTKNKTTISDMEKQNKCKNLARLVETSHKLLGLKDQNQQLVVEVEQLSKELESFRGYESRSQHELTTQMNKIQCFCQKLEGKLNRTQAELTKHDTKRDSEIKQYLNEKSLLETQAKLLQEEIINQKTSSDNLLNDIDHYKGVVKELTKTIQDLQLEIDQYRQRQCPIKPADIIRENFAIKEEMRERNCEILNLRATLEELNRTNNVNTPAPCQDIICTQNQQFGIDNDTDLKLLRKLADDIKNTQAKLTFMMISKQDNLNRSKANKCVPPQGCPVQSFCSAAVNEIDLKKDLNQQEAELEYLWKRLYSQTNKLTGIITKRKESDSQNVNKLNIAGNKKEVLKTVLNCFESLKKDVGVFHIHTELQKMKELSNPTAYSQKSESISNLPQPTFQTYHTQLMAAITKYRIEKTTLDYNCVDPSITPTYGQAQIEELDQEDARKSVGHNIHSSRDSGDS